MGDKPRHFAYNELGQDNPVVVDEDEIRRTYWPHWVEQMEAARERGSTIPITWENCLLDFQVVNWAWEITDEDPDLHGV